MNDPDVVDELKRKNEYTLNELQRQLNETQQHLKVVERSLYLARKRPWKLISTSIRHRLANWLADSSIKFSDKQRDKFAFSASKRHPSRGLLFVDSHGRVGDNVKLNEEDPYQKALGKWAAQRGAQADRTKATLERLRRGPLISVVVPVYNPDIALMCEMIRSIQKQSYPNWELCLADDCSSNPDVRETLTKLAAEDTRIRLAYRESNGHISAATNSAIEIAKGSYLAFVDHDDLLDPDALLWVVKTICDGQNVRIVYTDEDKVRADGTRFDPHFKPDWNREFIHHINYVSHLGVYETDMVRRVGGLRVGFEGAQDYDLLLRCTEGLEPYQIVHIPKVLYSWRATEGSTAESLEAKPYASRSGERALAEHLSRVEGKSIPVEAGPIPFTYRPIWPVENDPLVSIIIPTKDKLDYLRTTVDSILENTTYQNFEICIVDNGSTESATLAWLKQIQQTDTRIHVLRDDGPFNYSALNNTAIAKSRGEFVALVNNDIEVIDADWLREMVSLAQRPDVGCVGAKLHYPDGRIQHAGVVIGLGGVAGHVHLLSAQPSHGYFARLSLRQEYTAVTAACLVLRRDVFDEVGGLNETDLKIAFNDVDLCLKVNEAGYRNVWTPWARLYHHESVSRGPEDNPEKQARFAKEIEYMQKRWSTHTYHDQAYNPNLSLTRQDFGMGPAKWTSF